MIVMADSKVTKKLAEVAERIEELRAIYGFSEEETAELFAYLDRIQNNIDNIKNADNTKNTDNTENTDTTQNTDNTHNTTNK